jgi:hypothetical protein
LGPPPIPAAVFFVRPPIAKPLVDIGLVASVAVLRGGWDFNKKGVFQKKNLIPAQVLTLFHDKDG